MSVDLSNYEEVDERLRKFFDKYPLGSMQTVGIEYRDLPAAHLDGEPCLHVIYHAAAYRNPEDERPGQGVASEPFPGLTNYTKGSEIMNAETSAWGRALVALGFVAKKVASANEVRNRQSLGAGGSPSRPGKPSEPQAKLIQKLVKSKKVTPEQLRIMLDTIGVSAAVEPGWTEHLSPGKDGTASQLISWLTERPLPSIEHPTDVPANANEFEHPRDDGKDTPIEMLG